MSFSSKGYQISLGLKPALCLQKVSGVATGSGEAIMVETVLYPKMSLPKAIPMKCFVPHHPLVKVSAKSVGRLDRKEKKNKQTNNTKQWQRELLLPYT